MSAEKTRVLVVEPVELEGVSVALYFHSLRHPDAGSLGASWVRDDSRPNLLTAREKAELLLRLRVNESDVWPELVKAVAIGPGEEILGAAMPAPGQCTDDPRSITITIGARGGTLFTDFLGYHEDLLARIAGQPAGEVRDQMAYFAELNLNTHHELLDLEVQGYARPHPYTGAQLKDPMARMRDTLKGRLLARAKEFGASGNLVAFDPLPAAGGGTKVSRGEATVLSDIQLKVLENHFAVDSAPAPRAFERFANGELRLQLSDLGWSTQPSSGYYFLFAEFAQLAIDEGIDENAWRALRPALIYTQEIMTSVYAVSQPEDAQFFDYEACRYDECHVYDEDAKQGLRDDFVGKTDDDLLACLAQNTLDSLGGAVADFQP